MNDSVQQLKQIRENIKYIEEILTRASNNQTQIFINFRIGRNGEQFKETSFSDYDNLENETNIAYNMYTLMLEGLKKSEIFWKSRLKRELKEIEDELYK